MAPPFHYDVHFAEPPFGPYTYTLETPAPAGGRVLVPLGNRTVIGVCDGVAQGVPAAVTPKPIREVLDVEPLFDAAAWTWLKDVADRYACTVGEVVAAALPVSLNRDADDAVILTAAFCAASEATSLDAGAADVVAAVSGAGWLSRRAVGDKDALVELNRRGVLTWEPCAKRPALEDVLAFAVPGVRPPRRGRPAALFDALSSGPRAAAPLFADANLRPALRGLLSKGAARLGIVPPAGEPGERGNRGRALIVGGERGSRLERVFEAACDTDTGAVLVVVPEIHMVSDIRSRCEAAWGRPFAAYHSDVGGPARWDVYRRVARGTVRHVVGTAAALFLPLPTAALVIVWEEGDNAYKRWERAPLAHARVLAEMRCATAPLVVAGTAPSPEAYAAAAADGTRPLILPPPPSSVEVVDMNRVLATEGEVIFSAALVRAIGKARARRETAVLLVNRRGYIPYLFCRTCGEAIRCDACDVALAYHRDDATLRCRYCGRRFPLPRRCPTCSKGTLVGVGLGVEKVAAEAALLFGDARIGRADSDGLATPARARAFWEEYDAGRFDVVVGTQMVLRALESGTVGLAAMVNADAAFNLPDFRASEQTYRLIARLLGPKGRDVLIQTFHADHYAIKAAAAGDYRSFVEAELALRRRLGLPPASTLVNVVISGDAAVAETAAADIGRRLTDLFGEDGVVIGPVPAPVAAARGQRRWQVLIKTTTAAVSRRGRELTRISRSSRRLRVVVDVDPYEMS